ncbi:MAG: precorrin-6y C5,15-methyltransferase (decarboxylating) subunit CbiE [Alphaproteobacteria bacterium]|nr:precorrin-6y C5,15-methyltransferase (decarboxylating) subunit CbiE [Alphaproteobacteria bacterium]
MNAAAWISVIGLGEEGLAGLSPEARAAIEGAEVLVGGERHLALVPGRGAERLTWRTPLKDTMADIAARRGKRVVVLATGDPMWFGVGVTLAKHFPADALAIMPRAGAFSLAAARLGWSLADTATITLHGRKLALLNAHIAPGARLLILSENAETPRQVAAALVARGYPDSAITVLEHMGGPAERRVEGTAATWGDRFAAELNTIAVACVAGPDAVVLPNAPGLPDALFQHDGQLTKREVRAASLAALMPLPGQTLWDVGSGSGSIAIEWMRAARGARAFAIERSTNRCRAIARNAAFFGVPDLKIVEGRAPDALDGLPAPDAVFIGGGIVRPGLHEACWHALRPGGRLVANVVTVEGEVAVARLHATFGGTLTRIAVSRADPVGELKGWRPFMPVTQFAAVKK